MSNETFNNPVQPSKTLKYDSYGNLIVKSTTNPVLLHSNFSIL